MMAIERRGRRTGYVEWRGPETDKQWHTRVTDRATGKLRWLAIEADVPAAERLGPSDADESIAQKLALIVQQKYENSGWVPCERDLTVNEFFGRWNEWRRGTSLANQADDDERAYRLHIKDQIGTTPLYAVTRDRLIAFSYWLDTQVALPAETRPFAGKRARNIFAVVAAMFRDAFEAKNPEIRILDANPCEGVPWPDAPEADPLLQQLFREEFLALVRCPVVPVVRRRLYAVALYTQTRIGEVRVLDCEDVSVEHRFVRILKADDRKKDKQFAPRRGVAAKKTKKPKSNRSRTVTLEHELAPIVFQMIAERDGKGRLFPDRPKELPKGNQHHRMPVEYIPGTSKACEVFRRDLRLALAWAGLEERPELFDSSDTEASLPIRFHDLRATGVTWRHARGDRPGLIMQECGHEQASTNEIYIRPLRELRADDVFPPLPTALIAAAAGLLGETSGDADFQCPITALGALKESVFSHEVVPKEGVESRPRRHRTQRKAPRRPKKAGSHCPTGDVPRPSGTSVDSPDRTVAERISVALEKAAAVGRWDIVAELSRLLPEPSRAEPPKPAAVAPVLRLLPGRRKPC